MFSMVLYGAELCYLLVLFTVLVSFRFFFFLSIIVITITVIIIIFFHFSVLYHISVDCSITVRIQFHIIVTRNSTARFYLGKKRWEKLQK